MDGEKRDEIKGQIMAEGVPVEKPPGVIPIGRVGNFLQQEPVLVNAFVTIIVGVAAWFGTSLDTGEVFTVVGAVFTVGSIVVRQYAVPLPKAEKAVAVAYASDPVVEAKPGL